MKTSPAQIDHVMLISRDLAQARSQYQRMGFHVTPRTFHPHGTANHLLMFQRSFVELLGVVSPEKLDSRSEAAQVFLQIREGIAALALPSDDAKRDREALIRRGLAPSDIYSFDRPVTLPDGREVRAVIDTVWTSLASAPLIQVFLSQQHVPEAIWVPDWQKHPNGAREIAWLTLVADDPAEELGAHLAAFLDTEIVRDEGGRRTFSVGDGELRILSPKGYEAMYGVAAEPTRPYIAGIGIRVADLGTLAVHLRDGGVAHQETDQIVRVLPGSAHGALLEFTV